MKILFLLITSFSGLVLTHTNPEISVTQRTEKCEITKTEKIIDGTSMEPMIQDREKVTLLSDFYRCSGKKPQRGDLVAYEYGGNKNPLIKGIIATSEDFVEIRGNILFVENVEIKNSGGESYHFTKGELNMLKMYISEENHIPENSYFILGDNIYNSIDSRKFGAISAKNFLGKFEKVLVE